MVLPDFEAFFARYGEALNSGDLAGVISCFDPPSSIIDDDSTTLMVDRTALENYFAGIDERYRAQGAFSATATVERVERLTPALWLVDLRWDSFDETGAPAAIAAETYKYLLRVEHPDHPLIVTAIVTEV